MIISTPYGLTDEDTGEILVRSHTRRVSRPVKPLRATRRPYRRKPRYTSTQSAVINSGWFVASAAVLGMYIAILN